MDERVPRWVRIVMVVGLAGMQLYTGLWAVLSPRSWFDDFPGIGPDLVSAEPPYNQHLATDAGAAFLCTGVALVVAALLGRRSGVYVALAAYLAFAVPHAWYHVAHDAPGLSSGEQALSGATLLVGIGLAVLLAWGARKRPSSPDVRPALPPVERQPA